MSPQRFSTGAHFRWQGSTYRVLRLLPNGQVNLEDLLTGTTLLVDMATLVRALFDEDLVFVVDHPQASSAPATGPDHPAASLPLSDHPAQGVAIARYRLEVIQPLLTLNARTRAAVSARVQEMQAAQPPDREHTLYTTVSIAGVYRWIAAYTRSGYDLRALIPDVHDRGGKHTSRLRTEVNALIEVVIQDKSGVPEKVTVDDVRHELAVRLSEENRVRPAADHLPLPSRATVARRLAAAAQVSTSAARHRSRASVQPGQTPYPQVPLERVEIDHTRSDLIVIDDGDNLPLGRLTLTYCLDLATRYPLGYYLGFEPPSYLTVLECLHHAILPKGDIRARYGTEHDWLAYGIPATLVIDNGKEFLGRDLEEACCLLGIVLQHTPAYTPQFKAGVERMFGSLNTMLFHTLPGTTFSNPAERGDYDSAGQACVYLSEVDKVMHLFAVDIYAERFHRGLNAIPARCWEEKTRHGFAPALPPSAQELSILLSRTDTRVLHPYGIEFASLRYNGDELIPLRTRLKGQATRIKYHPADLSCLYVYDPFEQQYLRVPALDQDYTTGLSLWKHRVIRQAVLEQQAHVDPVALGQAKRKIQAMMDEGRQRKRRQTRTRMARWDTAGKPTRQVAAGTRSQEAEPVRPTPGAPVLDLLEDTDWEISTTPLPPFLSPARATQTEADHG